jgi:hypothetical protein
MGASGPFDKGSGPTTPRTFANAKNTAPRYAARRLRNCKVQR